jgi:ferritin-like metal-binding protein YciE
MADGIQDQLVQQLVDVHSMTEQALTQLRRAPGLASDPEMQAMFEMHLAETEKHETRVRERLAAHDADPSTVKVAAGKVAGSAMVLFARSQLDTPGKLVAHVYAYEHMEIGACELLRRVAKRAGDEETALVARDSANDDRAMSRRLIAVFDTAVDASVGSDGSDLDGQLDAYLADAHAIEQQGERLMEQAQAAAAGCPALAELFARHRDATRGHRARIERRLDQRGTYPSRVKDAAARAGGIGALLEAKPDTPARTAELGYAFEHLEIAAYELLCRTADRAGDVETVATTAAILPDERAMAKSIQEAWDQAIDAGLPAGEAAG